MARYGARRRRRLPARIWLLLLIIVLVGMTGALVARHKYYAYLEPVSTVQTTQLFTVETDSSVKMIADKLQKAGLIRSSWAFQLYVQRRDEAAQLQAGTYALAPSATTPQIAKTLSTGKVETKLVTILPGRRIDQIRADLINDGFSPAAVDKALDPAAYSGLPALSYKPAGVNTLEGLLWPDSYQKQPDTNPSVIVRESLVAMGNHLTPDVQAAFAGEGLTTYQGIILTSIVIQEVNKPSDQAQAAQVFLTRLKTGMPLGSDVTANYGAIAAGKKPSLTYDSPYNTRLHTGLPPSPISTISAKALYAATHPAGTNWLYFVTGDNGNTYFSTNLQDHETQTQQYCHKLCSN